MRQALWHKEVMYAIKGLLFQKIEVLTQEKRKLYAFLRQTHIVAYKGAVCSQKGTPRVHWILGILREKHKGRT